MTINWQRFREVIGGHQRFLLTSHIRPDCDALGSELGMAGVLESLGKEVMIVNGDPVPVNLRFIDPQARIKTLHEDVATTDLKDFDALMVLDTSAWAQLGSMGDVLRETSSEIIVFDHHVSEDDLGAESFKDPGAEATGVLVAEAAKQLGVALTSEIATPLFAAVATDTGWFRFPSVSGQTYRTVAQFVDAGASPPGIYGNLYEQDTVARVCLRGIILARVQCELDGRLGHTNASLADFETAGALRSDTEDVINMVLAIAGVEFAVFFVELPNNQVKVSFRSRCSLDCSKFAEQFGGGGHRAAAGATIAGSFTEIQQLVLDRLRTAMQDS